MCFEHFIIRETISVISENMMFNSFSANTEKTLIQIIKLDKSLLRGQKMLSKKIITWNY